MGRIATVSLTQLVPDELMRGIARWIVGARPGFVTGDGPRHPDEVELFDDWDGHRGHGVGHYSGDADECRSRRIDLRGPTDLDPGPLPMDEPTDEDVDVLELCLSAG